MWNFAKSEKRTLRVPFNGIPRIFVEDYTVVLISRDDYQPNSVVVWDTFQDDVRVVGSFRKLWLFYLDMNEKLLVAFTRGDDDKPLTLEQTKWALNGQKLDTKLVQLSPPGRRFLWNDAKNMSECAQLYCRKKVTKFLAWDSNHDMLHVTYNPAMDKLSARLVQTPKELWQNSHWDRTCVLLTHSIVYGLLEARKLYIYNALDGNTTIIPYQRDMREISGNDMHVQTFGDREVFGVVSHDGTQLWFFNPNFVINSSDFAGMDFVGM